MLNSLGNLKEEELIDWLKKYLDYSEIINDDFPAKGASSWYPYGYSLITNILNLASLLMKKAGFEEIVLPSFVHGEDFMKECRHIKDFSGRVYWSPLYEENDLHVVTPTIEAQLGALYVKWLSTGKTLPFKYFTVRGVGRYETGRTIPLWKERNVWPFFEGLSAHDLRSDFITTINKQVVFMQSLFDKLGIPTVILERPKINPRLREYSERRIEAVTITRDRRVVILANVYDLGEIFSKVYEIYSSVKKKRHYALTSAIGLSGRILAVLLAINGDLDGFITPPYIAPIKVAIIPIYDKTNLLKEATKVKNHLLRNGIVSKIFLANSSLGDRRKKARAMGIPFVIEIGQTEIKTRRVTLKPRAFIEPISSEVDHISSIIKQKSQKLELAIRRNAASDFNFLNRVVKSKQELIESARQELLTKTFFCDEPSCYNNASQLLKKEIIGCVYDVVQYSQNKCIICGRIAVQSLYLGVKWKGEK